MQLKNQNMGWKIIRLKEFIELYREETRKLGEVGHHFDKDTMKFFDSRPCSQVWKKEGYYFFIDSIKPPNGDRIYKIKTWDGKSRTMKTILKDYKNPFDSHKDLRTAKKILKEFLASSILTEYALTIKENSDDEISPHHHCSPKNKFLGSVAFES